jgi:hypothetical protein
MRIELYIDIDALEVMWKFFQSNGQNCNQAVRGRWTYHQERADQAKVSIPYQTYVLLKDNEG